MMTMIMTYMTTHSRHRLDGGYALLNDETGYSAHSDYTCTRVSSARRLWCIAKIVSQKVTPKHR